ncbi:type II toxin-antitoxin system death-on-curing family toxin [Paenibacillus medicaginis]|uniref:Type II toxin-antitoxin system death-on-curing family toxin n=1 Tax=Paenibacillus medicaginis TaxID=1470560 RepID=A0ABV5C3H0_9BACL
MYVRLTVDQIVEIHDTELAESNGLAGIKEPGYLEFIAEKPFSVFFGNEQYPGLFLKAAVLMSGLIKSHCFNDANKRTGVVSTYIFLKLNGHQLDAAEDDLLEMAIRVAKNEISEERLASWLEQNSYRE